MTIRGKSGAEFLFRKLARSDAALLGAYFLSLSKETQSKYGPHPLTAEHAGKLCQTAQDTADRFIVLEKNQNEIIGYFIVEYGDAPDEANRYRAQGIDLESMRDPIFAPSMADAYQNKGIASLVMPLIIDAVKKKRSESGADGWHPRNQPTCYCFL